MTEKRFTLEMQYWKGNPQGRKLFDNLTGQDGMSLEELCNIASDLHSKCEELESVLEVYEDSLDKFEDENKELKEILKHTYEIHECETCKHNENFSWLDPATMNREYDSRCGKGLHYGDEVHGCEEYELDLEMFKKRVKR